MIIIWGSRSIRKDEMSAHFDCMACNQPQEMKIVSFRSWFTFFFIPVFPTSKKKFYLECINCENTYKIKDDIKIEELLEKENAR